jgi:hypothetical protein
MSLAEITNCYLYEDMPGDIPHDDLISSSSNEILPVRLPFFKEESR